MTEANKYVTFDPPVLMAFWKYDLFPHCLYGPVVGITPLGSVVTSNYGPGHYFKPFLLLPLQEGEELGKELMKLREDHCKAIANVDAQFKGRAKRLITIPK